MIQKIKYFQHLDGLRFILSTMVIVGHLSDFNFFVLKESDNGTHQLLHQMALLAVSLFFTLSGFLISYNLFIEKSNSGKIEYKKFFKSRILRILPLYFLALFIYWILLPNSIMNTVYGKMFFAHLSNNTIGFINLQHSFYFIWCLLLMPQVAFSIGMGFEGALVYGGHLWSIGVEEFFYVVLPFIIFYSKSIKKNYLLITGFYYAVFIAITLISVKALQTQHLSALMKHIIFAIFFLVSYTKIVCMLIGSAGAYIFIYKKELLEKMIRPKIVFVAAFIFLMLLVFKADGLYFVHELYSFLFLILIWYFISIDNKNVFLENKVIRYLGKITYGVYVYHPMAMCIVYFLFRNSQHTFATKLIIYISTFLLTYLISTVSFELMEKKILRFKNK